MSFTFTIILVGSSLKSSVPNPLVLLLKNKILLAIVIWQEALLVIVPGKGVTEVVPTVYEDKKLFQVYDNKIWFLAFTDISYPGNLLQMWNSDGTSSGTIQLPPTNGWAGGFSNTYNIYATSFGMFMIYNDPITGDELYIYNNITGTYDNLSNNNSVSLC